MLIVKPYGRSYTARDAQRNSTRSIRLNSEPDRARQIGTFAKEHPELVIAQWISAIDKIAAKPSGNRRATPEQKKLRQALGDAAYALLKAEEGLLSGDCDDLKTLWNAKLHPYPEKTGPDPKARVKGRWFERFAGKVDPADVDAATVARKIHDHLYLGELRICGDRPVKRRGLIEARADSIAANVLKPLPSVPDETPLWSFDDEDAYERAGDVAAEIFEEAPRRDAKPAAGRRPKRFGVREVAPILFKQYGRLFVDAEGRVLSIAEAREARPGLFALHMAVKRAYTQLLKRHRKTAGAPHLPRDFRALLPLIERQSVNRDLNALVRLGKVIHYEASRRQASAKALASRRAEEEPEKTPDDRERSLPDRADAVGHIASHWPAGIDGSFYWTSEGQAEIKRNEAFVRVWRHVIAMAARTLTDWADPDGEQRNDILGDDAIRRVTGQDFHDAGYAAKADLLFGNRADLFKSSDSDGDPVGSNAVAFRKSVLTMALRACANLRNRSFHFKGRGGFMEGLARCAGSVCPQALAAARGLWERDRTDRSDRLQAVMTSAHFDHFLEQPLLDALCRRLAEDAPPAVPLPRFRRVLTRSENAWDKPDFKLRLPPARNREDLEQPARLCQYSALKLLYERGFAAWLSDRDTARLKSWIDRAVKRTTKRAQSINRDERAVARAAGLIVLEDGEGINVFIDKLTAATATELRVQRGYDSDAEKARLQAKYLDDLRCDVVAQAFEDYLNGGGFQALLDIPADREKPESPLSVVPEIAFDAGEAADDWQAVLYVVCHLVPVEEIGKLLHQLRKWTLLEPASPASVAAVQRTFGLYLDMHDAKFEGGNGLPGRDALKTLFEGEALFAEVLPPAVEADADTHVPLRGLRELLRFGDLKYLMPVFERQRVAVAASDELKRMEKAEGGLSEIAEAQKTRQDLHERWVQKKQAFSDADKTAYREALKKVERHRHLKAQVTLTNHVRLHRLLMTVLGRLVDYAGLWERDLYFTALALMYLQGQTPAEVCSDQGLSKLLNGQIVEARKSFEDGFQRRLERYSPVDGKTIAVRNNLAHFNMLRKGSSPNLTALVNDTRSLTAHDRKLKNAVSQSIIELLHREGLTLLWAMDHRHGLTSACLETRQARHLGGSSIREDLLSGEFVEMVALLFGGSAKLSDNQGRVGKPENRTEQKRWGDKENGLQKKRRRRRKRRPRDDDSGPVKT